MEASLEGGRFTAVATHDETLIERAIAFAREREIPNDRFQFQMLYGVRPRLQPDLVRRGFAVPPTAGVVPLPHEAARRASCEPALLPAKPAPPLSPRTRALAIATSARSRASKYHDHGEAWSSASDQ
jgi:hypothetical protein